MRDQTGGRARIRFEMKMDVTGQYIACDKALKLRSSTQRVGGAVRMIHLSQLRHLGIMEAMAASYLPTLSQQTIALERYFCIPKMHQSAGHLNRKGQHTGHFESVPIERAKLIREVNQSSAFRVDRSS